MQSEVKEISVHTTFTLTAVHRRTVIVLPAAARQRLFAPVFRALWMFGFWVQKKKI
jgi:hypothetical protein